MEWRRWDNERRREGGRLGFIGAMMSVWGEGNRHWTVKPVSWRPASGQNGDREDGGG